MNKKTTLYLNEVLVPIFDKRAEDGFNVTHVEEGLSYETLFVEVDEWSNVVLDHTGVTIYQGTKGYHFDKSTFQGVSI